MARVMAKCPVCGENLVITEFSCSSCGTTIRGRFELDEFFRLSPEQLNFLRIFIKARGNLSELQKELGISYPTARSRLENIVRTLGYEAKEIAEKNDNPDSSFSNNWSPGSCLHRIKTTSHESQDYDLYLLLFCRCLCNFTYHRKSHTDLDFHWWRSRCDTGDSDLHGFLRR